MKPKQVKSTKEMIIRMKKLVSVYLTLPVFALVLLLNSAVAQDFHLSQYDAATLYLNPALTASYFKEKVDYRMYADYRSQWKAVSSTPYSTSYLAFDMPKNRFGMGGYLINNHSGTGGFNTFNFMLSGSYEITETKTGPHFLRVGLQVGIINKSFNPDKFTFDSQYSGSSASGFDNGISSNEIFDKTSLLKFDANMGVYYKYKDKRSKLYPFFGFSVFHLTMPDESFTSHEQRLPLRFVLNGGSDVIVNDRLRLTPSLLFMTQDKATELNMGVLGYYNIADTKFDAIFGLSYRLKDALILQCGIKQNNHVFRISYDITTSYLSTFSGNRGGVEFSLIFSGRKKESLFQF